MRHLISLLIILLPLNLMAQKWNAVPTSTEIEANFNWVMQEIRQPESKNILVVAHRGDWRNAPENSVQGLISAINMGVDIVEIDLKMTKDGHLILMHDRTIDRTTNGKGAPQDMTLDSIRTFFLKCGITSLTHHKIPTFEEYMVAAKGKMFICVDKCYPYLKQVVEILTKTGTLNQVLLNGEKDLTQNYNDYGDLIKQVNFKPVVNVSNPSAVKTYLSDLKPAVIELVFSADTSSYILKNRKIIPKNTKIWYNALWAELCAGHQDDIAVEQNRPQDSWEWLINHGATIIQTDRPQKLLWYLKDTKRHR